MKRVHLIGLTISLAGLLSAQLAHAQPAPPVDIHLKSKKGLPIKLAVIAAESVEGIRLNGQTNVLPADDIEDVDYSNRIVMPATLRILYGAAFKEESDAAKATKKVDRDDYIDKALTKYQQILKDMPKELLSPRRHMEFKIAYLTALLGLGSDKQLYRVDAIKKLTEFKKNHPDSWQYTQALLTLVKLYAEQKNFDDMRATVAEVSANPAIPAKIKAESKMLVIRLFMEEGKALIRKKDIEGGTKKFGEAQKDLDGLLSELPKDSVMRLPAQLALAQCKAISKDKKAEATKELEKLLQESTEKDIRAIIYNTLGEIYYDDGKLQDARWQFLWVDVIYNQDKEERAKALYYLWKIFNQLGEPERGQEYFEALATNPNLAGTYYQEKALKESKEA
jgi:hypothetical protein